MVCHLLCYSKGYELTNGVSVAYQSEVQSQSADLSICDGALPRVAFNTTDTIPVGARLTYEPQKNDWCENGGKYFGFVAADFARRHTLSNKTDDCRGACVTPRCVIP